MTSATCDGHIIRRAPEASPESLSMALNCFRSISIVKYDMPFTVRSH